MKINTPNKIDCAQGWIRNGLILLTVCGVLAAGVIGMLILQNTGPKADKESPPKACLLYTSPSPRDLSTSRMPSCA